MSSRGCHGLLERTTEMKYTMNKLKRDIRLSFRCCQRDFGILGNELVQALQQNQSRQSTLMQALEREQRQRRQLQQQYATSDINSLRVLCRVRSSSEQDVAVQITSMQELQVYRTTSSLVSTSNHDSSPPCKRFSFDRVVGDNLTQAELYQQEIEPLVQAVMDGQHACVLAYGATGTGKTQTLMHSSVDERGVFFHAVHRLLEHIQVENPLYTFSIALQMVEIYNDDIYDLLGKASSREKENHRTLCLTQCPMGELRHGDRGISLRNVASWRLKTIQDIEAAIEHGQRHRVIYGSTPQEHMARSHCVLTLRLKRRGLVDGRQSEWGRLVFVDLAGSERLMANTDTMTPSTLREAQHINKSLSAVGDVLAALQAKEKHIPYRNSKLTHLLQDSLTTISPNLLLVHVHDRITVVQETINSLQFASRVSQGKRPHRRQERLEVHRLQGIITSQSAQLQALQDKLDAEVELRRKHEKRLEEYRQVEYQQRRQILALPSTPQTKTRGLAQTTPEQLYGTRRWSLYTKRNTPTNSEQENTPENLLSSHSIMESSSDIKKSPTPASSTPLRRSRRLSREKTDPRTPFHTTDASRKRKSTPRPMRSILKKQCTVTIENDNGASKQVSFDLTSSQSTSQHVQLLPTSTGSKAFALRVPINSYRVPMAPGRVRTSQSIMSSPAIRVKTIPRETTPNRNSKPNWNGTWR